MTYSVKTRRIASLLLAIVFTMVTVLSAASVPAYAASKPSKVKDVKVSAVSASSVSISWKKTKKAKKYEVFRATKKKGKYKKARTVKTTYFVDTGLKANTKYYYKVRAVKGKKKGKYSAIKSVKTPGQNVIVNAATKTVSFSCTVNGKYFTTSTRHFIIDKNGFNKGKAVLTGDISPVDLYNGLVQVGGVSWSSSRDKSLKNGELISTANAENKNFSHLEVTVSWGGKTYPLSEVLKLSNGASPAIDMVFSGNPDAAAKTPSGCIACLDSCYIGIISNMKYGLCVIDNNNPAVFARADRLPANGAPVQVNIRVK